MRETSAEAALAGEIARAVRARGGRALVVGGWVRDRLLREAADLKVGTTTSPKDLDMEVFGVSIDELPRILGAFGKVEPIGQTFPVYKIGNIDIGLPRRESKSGRGHKGFIVEGDPSISPTPPGAAISGSTQSHGIRLPTSTKIRLTAAPILRTAFCASSIRLPSPTTAFAPCALSSLLRASS